MKIYLSQANQAHNAGPGGYIEKAGMDAISKQLAAVLRRDSRFTVKRNVAGARVDTASENCAEANAWGADYYVALHSNAGERGTVVFYHSSSAAGLKLAQHLLEAIGPLSPGGEVGDRVRPMDGFIEIHTPHAPAALIELEAHDWKPGVAWLTGKRPQIARALYEGICRGIGLSPLPLVDYRPLKRAALKVAHATGVSPGGVNAASNSKGPAFEQLLRRIADYRD